MKKLLFLFAIGAGISFASCKKSYDCSCTTVTTTRITQFFVDTTITESYNQNKKIEARSKKKGQTECDDHKRNLENEYGNYQISTPEYSASSNTSCTMSKE